MSKLRLISQDEAASKAVKSFNDFNNRDWGLIGVDTGLHDLNCAIGGWQGGKVYTIAARSGIGKSALTIGSIYAASIRNNHKSLVFSWEMSEVQYTNRIVSYITAIPSIMLGQGSKLLSKEDKETVNRTMSDISTKNITYQTMSLNESFISMAIESWYEDNLRDTENKGVVVIDYIGLAEFEDGVKTYAIGNYMKLLKKIALRFDIPIVVLAQLSRAIDKEKKPPTLADLADSADIERTSDSVILMHRPEYLNIDTIEHPITGDTIPSENKLLLRIMKNRDGRTGDFILDHNIGIYRFKCENHTFGYDYNELYKRESFWRRLFLGE